MYFEELNVPQNHIYLFKPHDFRREVPAWGFADFLV